MAGHVDATGELVRRTPLGEALELWFRAPAAVGRYSWTRAPSPSTA
ncbi:MAG: hypothetical protein R3F43_11140 [bacterium]